MNVYHSSRSKRLPTPLLFALVLATMTLWPHARASVMAVCPSGCDFTTIQAAIDAARSGDEIHIGTGIFREKVRIMQKSLKLHGEGAHRTVIDATDQGGPQAVIEVECKAAGVVLIGDLTITGGLPSAGFGGGGLRNSCRLSLESVVITNNAARAGGGILNSGSLELYDSVVSHNAAFDLSGGGIENSGDLFMAGCTIANNSARSGGGGIASSGSLYLEYSTISGNSARLGAGIAVTVGSRQAQLRNVLLSNNRASDKGGGVWNGAELEIRASLILANAASGVAGDGWGGGLYNDAVGIVTLRNSTISRNRADSQGGGIYNRGGRLTTLGTTTIANNAPDNCAPGSCP